MEKCFEYGMTCFMDVIITDLIAHELRKLDIPLEAGLFIAPEETIIEVF